MSTGFGAIHSSDAQEHQDGRQGGGHLEVDYADQLLSNLIVRSSMANPNRSNTVIDAGLPRDVSAATVAVESVAMTYPVFAYTRDVDEVFVSRD